MSETQFFYHLFPEIILSAVEETGVRCTGRLLQLNSLENRVYEVEIEVDQEKIESRYDAFRVVKFYRPGRWSEEQIREEHQFLLDLHRDDIPVVPPLFFPDGDTLHCVADQQIFFTVFPKVGGRSLDEFSDPQLEKIGRTIARVHLLGARKKFQHRLSLDAASFGKESLEYLLAHDWVPDTIRVRYTEVVEQICQLAERQLQGYSTQRVHGDLHFGNTIWNGDECTLVDLDDSVTAPAVQDIWLLAPGRDLESQKSRQSILRGYEQLRDFNYDELRLIESLRALRIIRYAAWIARRFSDPAFKAVFPSFGSLEYWRDQLIAVEEQAQLIHSAGE